MRKIRKKEKIPGSVQALFEPAGVFFLTKPNEKTKKNAAGSFATPAGFFCFSYFF